MVDFLVNRSKLIQAGAADRVGDQPLIVAPGLVDEVPEIPLQSVRPPQAVNAAVNA